MASHADRSILVPEPLSVGTVHEYVGRMEAGALLPALLGAPWGGGPPAFHLQTSTAWKLGKQSGACVTPSPTDSRSGKREV